LGDDTSGANVGSVQRTRNRNDVTISVCGVTELRSALVVVGEVCALGCGGVTSWGGSEESVDQAIIRVSRYRPGVVGEVDTSTVSANKGNARRIASRSYASNNRIVGTGLGG